MMIETKRLLLREVSAGDAALLAGGLALPGQRWHDGYPLEGTRVAARMLLRAAEAGTSREGFGMFQMMADGVVVGDLGFHGAPNADGEVEIGYGIVPARRGEGLVSEAVRALAAWALAQPGVTAVVAETDEGHEASERVLRAAGFVSEPGAPGMRRFRLTRSPA